MESEAFWRLSIFLGVLLAMLAWEAKRPMRPVDAELSRFRRVTNLCLAVINTVVVRAAFFVSAVLAATWAEASGIGLLHWLQVPFLLALVFSVIFLDFAIYWQHVIFHKVPMFWRLHRVHHSDPEFDVTTALRFHPVEIFLSMAIKSLIVIALGAPLLAVILFEIILNASAMFNHGNVSLGKKLDNLVRRLIVTPDMHRTHHSTIKSETDSNFGFFLSIWDRLFGTYTEEPNMGQIKMEIGLTEYQDYRSASKGGLVDLVKQPLNR